MRAAGRLNAGAQCEVDPWALLNDFGHDEYDVQRIIRSVLNKLPPAESIESIDLRLPRRRPRL